MTNAPSRWQIHQGVVFAREAQDAGRVHQRAGQDQTLLVLRCQLDHGCRWCADPSQRKGSPRAPPGQWRRNDSSGSSTSRTSSVRPAASERRRTNSAFCVAWHSAAATFWQQVGRHVHNQVGRVVGVGQARVRVGGIAGGERVDQRPPHASDTAATSAWRLSSLWAGWPYSPLEPCVSSTCAWVCFEVAMICPLSMAGSCSGA